MPYGLEHEVTQTELNAAGPISHHRFNSTRCGCCGLYATFSPWTETKDDGFVCGACSGQRCANSGCKKHPILAIAQGIQHDKDLDDSFCNTCWNVNLGRASKGKAKQKDYHTKARVPKTRVCKNPACNATAATNKDWAFEADHQYDEAFVRCQPCHKIWAETGEERVLRKHQKQNGPRTCCNCAKVQGPGEEGRWSRARDRGNDEWRCRQCHDYFKKNKADREKPAARRIKYGSDPTCANTAGGIKKSQSPGKDWRYQPGHASDLAYYKCGRHNLSVNHKDLYP